MGATGTGRRRIRSLTVASRFLLIGGVAFAGAAVPNNILELQPFSETTARGTATLVNLNPVINAWYVLTVSGVSYHLENANPRGSKFFLDAGGFVIAEGNNRHACDLFDALERGRSSRLIYYPMCDGRVYLRNPVKGNRTALEAATEFVRDQVWGGEKIIDLVHHLTADSHRDTAEPTASSSVKPASGASPAAASIDPQYANRSLMVSNLGIALQPDTSSLVPGAWYQAAGHTGIYVSVMQPSFIAPEILKSYKTLVNNLDNVEASALTYLIAFDLDEFELGYALGTEHPRVDWSDHVPAQMKDPSLPGPDGIGDIAPLVSTGLVMPEDGRRTVATFTGGFKRTHGAFRYGDLALKDHGSHYGFIENGVVFSKLQPGLATVFVLDDGSMQMKTWTEADDRLLMRIRHARQNGVPLIESGAPGNLVNRWGPGNWSGSEDERLRTMRAGVALLKSGGKSFLIYAVFSDATPSAMARVFQAYGCSYAMLTDMNALEHTYFALYRRTGSRLFVDRLLKGMSVLDKSAGDEVIPRFLGYPDNRDFFYVMRRVTKEVRP
jgi:hypothetical protein